MTTLRDAAQQVLEALKDYKRSDAYRVSIAIHILSTALDQERAEPVQEYASIPGTNVRVPIARAKERKVRGEE